MSDNTFNVTLGERLNAFGEIQVHTDPFPNAPIVVDKSDFVVEDETKCYPQDDWHFGLCEDSEPVTVDCLVFYSGEETIACPVHRTVTSEEDITEIVVQSRHTWIDRYLLNKLVSATPESASSEPGNYRCSACESVTDIKNEHSSQATSWCDECDELRTFSRVDTDE